MKRLLSLASCSLVGRLGGEFWAQACAPKPKTNDNNRLITPVIRHPPAFVRSGCNYPKSTLKNELVQGPTLQTGSRLFDVRFGSKADICSAKGDVRFTPSSDIDCVFRHVCFGSLADIRQRKLDVC